MFSLSIFRKCYFFLVVLCFGLVSADALALDVKHVRFGDHSGKMRMVLDLSDVADFRAFVLSSPYRMVVDLPTFRWEAGRVVRPARSMISDIRQGKLADGVSRVVFDLERPVIIESAFLLPKQGAKENRIVIDYSEVGSRDFEAKKGVVHGTLKVEDYKSLASVRDAIPLPPQNISRPKAVLPLAQKPLVIIDPGHGGADPGTVGKRNVYEKEIVLALSKELKKQLLDSGKYRVLMTRETDVFIRLKDRVKFARAHKGDLFISVHANSIHKPQVRGASIYTLSKKASDAQTAKLAEKENQADMMAGVDFHVEDEQVAFILGDFLMNDTMNQSKFLANTMTHKLGTHGIVMLPNPHRYAGFAVLKAPDIPSILVEAGFVSNANEMYLLTQSAHRQKIAQGIRAGVDAYFDNVYKNENN